MILTTGRQVIDAAKENKVIDLPLQAKELTAGLDWAGNSGRLIANLLFKEECFCEAYTVSSAQNLTWGEVAELYTELLGAKFSWVSLEEFRKATNDYNVYALLYDRLFDRNIDNRKILKATGLTNNDFISVKDGLKIELSLLNKEN